MFAGLGNLRDAGCHRVQVDVGTRRQQRLFIENRHAFEPPLEKSSPDFVLAVRESCKSAMPVFSSKCGYAAGLTVAKVAVRA
jgi:hypothetical protein